MRKCRPTAWVVKHNSRMLSGRRTERRRKKKKKKKKKKKGRKKKNEKKKKKEQERTKRKKKKEEQQEERTTRKKKKKKKKKRRRTSRTRRGIKLTTGISLKIQNGQQYSQIFKVYIGTLWQYYLINHVMVVPTNAPQLVRYTRSCL